jgi:hypothetical protein
MRLFGIQNPEEALKEMLKYTEVYNSRLNLIWFVKSQSRQPIKAHWIMSLNPHGHTQQVRLTLRIIIPSQICDEFSQDMKLLGFCSKLSHGRTSKIISKRTSVDL